MALIYGTSGNDVLDGTIGDDEIYGFEGNDTIRGGSGKDEIYGGKGNDTYFINDAFDFIFDEDGIDTAYVNVNFLKIPSSIETVIYSDGAQALPYWIDALLDDNAQGSNFQLLLGTTKTWNYSFPSTQPSYDTDLDNAKGWTAFTDTK